MLILSLFSLLVVDLQAQIPQTSLYKIDLQTNLDSVIVKDVAFISQFNVGGYTNQPAYMNEDEVYVSVRMKGTEQNDIYAIDIRRNTLRQVTDTPQSEYSPTKLPDGRSFACVREILGDEINQKMYGYPLDQSTNGKNLLRKVNNVGYFSFLNDSEVALFLVDGVSKLAIADLALGTTSFLSSDIGRCLRTNDDGHLVYVHKYTDAFWYLKTYDHDTKRAAIITETLPSKEDFCILNDGRIMMADGSKLFIHSGLANTSWKEIKDFSDYGIKNITRMAINNRSELIVVDQP